MEQPHPGPWVGRRRLVGALGAGAALAMLFGLTVASGRAQDVPVIAAAADLRFALPEVADLFARESGRQVRLAFGSSGHFRRQIAEQAPYELYLSADEDYVLTLHRDGFTVDRGTLYAVGRIVIITPHGAPFSPDAELAGLAAALDAGEITRFAIANPEHAPYGQRAREALEHAGLWARLEGRLVFGENVSQAAQFAVSGSTQGGIVAYSLALSPQLARRGDFALIPADWHRPLRQRMVLIEGAGETARAFYAYLQTEPARVVLRRHGFALPGEGS